MPAPARSATTSPGRSRAPGAGAHPRLPRSSPTWARPEYAEFLDLAERYERVRLDTTMVFTDFFARGAVPATACCRGWSTCSDKVLLGTDFPNIPYPYAHQLEALGALDLGDDWLRRSAGTTGPAVRRNGCRSDLGEASTVVQLKP